MTDLVWLLVFPACQPTVLARLDVLDLIMAVEPAECCCVLQTETDLTVVLSALSHWPALSPPSPHNKKLRT